MLKEYRCNECQKLFFRADIYNSRIEVKCKNCKTINMIEGTNCKLWLFANNQGSAEEGYNFYDHPKNFFDRALISCEACDKKHGCKHYHNMKKDICPMCKQDIKDTKD